MPQNVRTAQKNYGRKILSLSNELTSGFLHHHWHFQRALHFLVCQRTIRYNNKLFKRI